MLSSPVHIIAKTDLYCPIKVVDRDSNNINLQGPSPSSPRFFTSLTRSWSKGSCHNYHSSLSSKSPPVQTKAPCSSKSITTRRSDSQAKAPRSLPPLDRTSRCSSRSVYPAGKITSNLRRVGVEECRPWVTGAPPFTWPIVRATQGSTEAYVAITKYIPETLEQAIKDVEYTLQYLATEQSLLFLHNQHHQSIVVMDTSKDIVDLDDKIRDLELCVTRMEVLLSELRSNSVLQPIKDDGERDVHSWNRKLQHIQRAEGGCTFSTGPALFVQAYVYRRLKGCFTPSTFWKDHDVFFDRKCDDFVYSADRVLELCQWLSEPFNPGDCVFPWERLEKIHEAFFELLNMCSPEASAEYRTLLNMTESKLLGASDKSSTKVSWNLPVKDGDRMWEALSKNYPNAGSRVDFVLNNAGLELFCDLALADFMIQTGLASKIHFHGKQFPWFVSDATQKDWDWLIESLSGKRHLFHYPTSAERTSLQQLGERWKGYEKEGKFVYEQHPFWCTGFNFWELPTHAADLFSHLSTSSLVVFKGNSNYRRLIAGRRVPEGTPFDVAIGPMATHPRAPPVCSLRIFRDDGANDASKGYD